MPDCISEVGTGAVSWTSTKMEYAACTLLKVLCHFDLVGFQVNSSSRNSTSSKRSGDQLQLQKSMISNHQKLHHRQTSEILIKISTSFVTQTVVILT